MENIKITANCPKCGANIVVSGDIDPKQLVPKTRANLTPVGSVPIFRFSSKDIEKFVLDTARKFVPDIEIQVVPRYCEKKRRKAYEPLRSYASLRIAFSHDAIEKNIDMGWFASIGDNSSNVRIVKSLFSEVIRKYQYDRKEIEKWLSSYKTLEDLEDRFGMTEAYINDLKMYSTPQKVNTTGDRSWIIFSAAPENIFKDMFTDPETGQLAGKIKIEKVYPINRDIVEYEVHLYPNSIEMKEDHHVRQILLGEKPKK